MNEDMEDAIPKTVLNYVTIHADFGVLKDRASILMINPNATPDWSRFSDSVT